jgi:hypothetical protein
MATVAYLPKHKEPRAIAVCRIGPVPFRGQTGSPASSLVATGPSLFIDMRRSSPMLGIFVRTVDGRFWRPTLGRPTNSTLRFWGGGLGKVG